MLTLLFTLAVGLLVICALGWFVRMLPLPAPIEIVRTFLYIGLGLAALFWLFRMFTGVHGHALYF